MAYHKNAPLGVVVNDELVGSEVMVALRGTKVIFNSDSEAALGGVDVVAGPDAGIVVVTETDAIMVVHTLALTHTRSHACTHSHTVAQ